MTSPIVIFDLDKTLIASATMEPLFVELCAGEGADPAHALHIYQTSAGSPLHEQFPRAAGLPAESPRVRELLDAFWERLGDGDPTPLPGAEQTLRAVHATGVPIYLSTGSHPDAAGRWLAGLGWTPLFALVQGTTVEHAKGPDHYHAMYAHTGLNPAAFAARAVVVGDGVFDIRYARMHDVATRVAYTPAGTAPEHVQRLRAEGATHLISDLRELPGLLAERFASAAR